jgi:hypothetical protein
MTRCVLALTIVLLTGCGDGPRRSGAQRPPRDTAHGVTRSADGTLAERGNNDARAYTGHDANDIPHYAHRSFTDDEQALLRRVYGVEHPGLLYVSDSSDAGLLKYDTRPKQCRSCYVNSYRLGFVSLRRPGESWDQLERRVSAMKPSEFPAWARVENVSTADLDPAVRPEVEQMLAEAARAGFALRVAATYRSPEREAYLMAIGGGATHTLTSLHAYGRAIDLLVGDGVLSHAATRAEWIRFRRWVTRYQGGEFRILGAVDNTWDWRHVELPSSSVGFDSIDAALAQARACTAVRATVPCDFAPHLPSKVAPGPGGP